MSRIPWQRVRIKVLLATLACGVALLAVTNALFFRTALAAQREQLRRTLMGIASTGALTIDVEHYQRIPPRPESARLPDYRALMAQLRAIHLANPDIRYVYTLQPSATTGAWLFLGDTDEQEPAPPGQPYDVRRFPAITDALTGPAADADLVTDEWGTTLSGYAPIRNVEGRPVAILGVDMSAAIVRRTQQLIRLWFVVALAGGVLVALLLSGLVAAWIARPVQQLVEGTRRVGAGDLFHEVRVTTHDEFSTLAASFNQMTAALRHAMQDLRLHALSTVQSLVIAIEAKDKFTRGHSERVRHYAVKIAKRLVLPAEQVAMVERISVLHDIGKIGVKEAVLNKPDRLTSEEYEHVKEHPVVGERILAPLSYTKEEIAIVRSHHERQDGRGYPDGRRGKQIPLFVACVTVADAFDAMTGQRPYRPQPRTIEQAVQELRACVGTQFHPDAVNALIDILYEEGQLKTPRTAAS